MDTLKVLIVEDERLFGELLCQTLSAEPSIEVVDVVADGETAVSLATTVHPDAVLMDVELQGPMDGITAAIEIKKERKETGIVILSAHHNRRYLSSLPLESLPGWSYLLKQSVPDVATLVRAIQGSIAGMIMLDPEVVSLLTPRAGSKIAGLSRRQQDVLELIAQGHNNTEIAHRLGLARKSVETYINALYRDLELPAEDKVNLRVSATILFLDETQSR